eukprot:gene18275-28168_t
MDVSRFKRSVRRAATVSLRRFSELLRESTLYYTTWLLLCVMTVNVALLPGGISAGWLVLLVVALLRKQWFYRILTPVLWFAVVYALGVWIVALPGLVAREGSGEGAEANATESATVRRLQMFGFATSTCGVFEEVSCAVFALPFLGVLVLLVAVTRRVYHTHVALSSYSTVHPTFRIAQFNACSPTDRLHVLYHRGFLGFAVSFVHFVSWWTVDGVHAVLFATSIVFFYRPQLAPRYWAYVLFYVAAALVLLYLFNVLDKGVLPETE